MTELMNSHLPSLYERIGGREKLQTLLRYFYADVRQHTLLGPVFNQHIQDWPAHLIKIGEFWSRLTGGPSNFVGSLPLKHAPLGIDSRHFDAWLGLWEANCRCYLAPREAQELFDLAQTLGRRLRTLVVEKQSPELQLEKKSPPLRHGEDLMNNND